MMPVTSDKASWFQCFRQYWHLSFITTSSFFAMPGWEFVFRSPLFSVRVSKYGFDHIRQVLFSGVELWLLPSSWTLRPKEGRCMFRHEFRWGTRHTIERLRVLNGKVVKQ